MDLIRQKLFHFYFSSLILSNPKVSINSYVFSVVFAVLFGFVCMCVFVWNKIHWMAKEWQHNWHVHGTRKTFAEKRTNFCCHKWWKSSFAIIVFARLHHGVQTYLHTECTNCHSSSPVRIVMRFIENEKRKCGQRPSEQCQNSSCYQTINSKQTISRATNE